MPDVATIESQGRLPIAAGRFEEAEAMLHPYLASGSAPHAIVQACSPTPPGLKMKDIPCTLWLTGLSAAGKTTLAVALADVLAAADVRCQVLDGDVVRRELSRDLGFSKEDRSENIRRVADRCRELNDAGTWAIAALISPYRDDRELARQAVGTSRFVEVYLATSLADCEARDPKGLYRRARAGEIASFTGISDPYEVPLMPALSFDTNRQSLDECVAATVEWLASKDLRVRCCD